MNIAEFSIKNRLVMWIAIALSLVIGFQAYREMPRFEDPEFTIRIAQVLTNYPGASPQEVAEEITTPLETVLREIGEIDSITSTSTDGFSEIQIEVKYSASKSPDQLEAIWTKVRNKVDEAQSELPSGATQSVVYDEYGDVFGILYMLTGAGYDLAELNEYAEQLRLELLAVDGVSKVNISGNLDEVIFVEIPTETVASLGKSVDAIFDQLSVQNAIVPAGSLQINDRQVVITATGDVDSVAAIENLLISSSDGSVTRLGSIATVTRGYVDPPSSLAYYDGEPAIGIGIAVDSGSNVVAIGEALTAKLAELSSARPAGMELQEFYHQGKVVDQAIGDFVINLAFALAIVIVTLLIFIGIRSGLIIGAMLLITVAATLATMYWMNVPMHRISLGALIIALGMLVDNAIVVTDGILTGMRRGEALIKAASSVVSRCFWLLLVGTLVCIFAFSVVGLSPGAIAEYTRDLFWVIMIALFYSWLFAITLTPFLCDLLLKKEEETSDAEPKPNRFLLWFKSVVRTMIRARYLTLTGAISLFLLSVFGFNYVKSGFFPASTSPQVVVDYWGLEGTAISITDARLQEVAKFAESIEGVTNVKTLVGAGTQRYMLIYDAESQNSAYGQLLIKLENFDQIDRVIATLQDYVSTDLTDSQAKVWRFTMGPSGGAKIQAKFFGPDPAQLRRIADQATAVLNAHPDTMMVENSWRQQVPVIQVDYAEDQALRAGVSRSDLGNAVARAFSGEQVGTYREGDDLIPITYRAPARERETAQFLPTTQVSNSTGDTVPLIQVANSVQTIWRDGRIKKEDQVYSITAQADPAPSVLAGDVQADIQGDIEAIELPPGYSFEWDGELGSSAEANADLFSVVPYSFGAMVLATIFLFNGLRQPLVIWCVVPFALVGVVFGLIVMGVPLEFMAILGLLSLSGLLIQNAIVMVDEIDAQIANGKPRFDALVDSSESRLSPVVLGAATTALGLIPLFFDAFFQSMAVVLVFGLISGTVLTLAVVPTVYAILFRIGNDETAEQSLEEAT